VEVMFIQRTLELRMAFDRKTIDDFNKFEGCDQLRLRLIKITCTACI